MHTHTALDPRHLIPRLGLIANPPRRQEEKRHQAAPSTLRIMMAAGMRAGPPLALPAVQAHELRVLVDRNDAVDLAVRVRVVLALEVVFAVHGGHVHGGDGAEARGLGGRGDARAAVAGAVYGHVGDPAFVEAGFDEAGEGLVVWGAGTVVCVEVVFEGLAWSSGVCCCYNNR